GGVCDPVAVEAEGDAAGQAHGGDRSMLDRGGVEDDEVAAAFAGSPGDGEEGAVAFRGARGAGGEDGFGDRVAGGQGEGGSVAGLQVEPDQGVQPGVVVAFSGEAAEAVAQAGSAVV